MGDDADIASPLQACFSLRGHQTNISFLPTALRQGPHLPLPIVSSNLLPSLLAGRRQEGTPPPCMPPLPPLAFSGIAAAFLSMLQEIFLFCLVPAPCGKNISITFSFKH